jgi:hypothetical protein
VRCDGSKLKLSVLARIAMARDLPENSAGIARCAAVEVAARGLRIRPVLAVIKTIDGLEFHRVAQTRGLDLPFQFAVRFAAPIAPAVLFGAHPDGTGEASRLVRLPDQRHHLPVPAILFCTTADHDSLSWLKDAIEFPAQFFGERLSARPVR